MFSKRSPEKFIISTKQSGDEKEFVVACEGKLTFLAEASPEVNRMFSKRSAEKFIFSSKQSGDEKEFVVACEGKLSRNKS